VSEKRLRQERQISKYEFGFMPGKLTGSFILAMKIGRGTQNK
jgi:hypothetical protein